MIRHADEEDVKGLKTNTNFTAQTMQIKQLFLLQIQFWPFE